MDKIATKEALEKVSQVLNNKIAQQNYIFIPILDGGEYNAELVDAATQQKLFELAKDGRGMNVVFVDKEGTQMANQIRPINIFCNFQTEATYFIYDGINEEIVGIFCSTNAEDA